MKPSMMRHALAAAIDRGPTQADRMGDVSLAAARKLGMVKSGVVEAELMVVGDAPQKKR